jgi:hypothetical protein
MHKNATKCNKTQSKWCINKHGASKIIDTFETYHPPVDHTQFFMKSGGVTHYRNMQYTKKMGLDHVSSDTCWMNIGSPLLPHVLPSLVDSICLLILWKIWDARNAIVFRHIDQDTTTTIRNILSDLTLYSFRFKKMDQRVAVDLCRDHLSLYIL